MRQYADHIIDTWSIGTFEDSNGEAKIARDNESIWLEVYSDDEQFKTEIDIRDILYAISEVI